MLLCLQAALQMQQRIQERQHAIVRGQHPLAVVIPLHHYQEAASVLHRSSALAYFNAQALLVQHSRSTTVQNIPQVFQELLRSSLGILEHLHSPQEALYSRKT